MVNIPPGLEQALSRTGGDPAETLREAALVELYRMGRISHAEFAEGLGISRLDADAILKRHNVTEDLPTTSELADQLSHLRRLSA